MKITKQRLREIIKEELAEGSLNPEHDKASKIRSAIVGLADDLINSPNPEISVIADVIVKDLYGQVAWLEKRLSESFGE